MSTIRAASRTRYTTIDRQAVNDERLSFKAKGLLLWILDKPDDWSVRSEALAEVGPDGRESVRSGLRELESAGYIQRLRERLPDGTWHHVCIVHETPGHTEDGKPGAGPPVAGKPVAGTPASGEPVALMKTETEDCDRRKTSSSAPRPRNEIYDALARACGYELDEMTGPAQRACGVAAAELKKVGAEPAEIMRRAAAYRLQYAGAAITPSALAKHWASCNPERALRAAVPARQPNVAERYRIGREM